MKKSTVLLATIPIMLFSSTFLFADEHLNDEPSNNEDSESTPKQTITDWLSVSSTIELSSKSEHITPEKGEKSSLNDFSKALSLEFSLILLS